MQRQDGQLTVTEYARHEGISLMTAYHRVWKRKVKAEQVQGRWVIYVDQPEKSAEPDLEVVGVNEK